MIDNVNQNFKDIMHNKLSKKPGTKAVVGWFFGDNEAVVSYGDFGPMEPETMSFQIGSITKLFTATLASILYYEGKLDLKAHVGDYIQLEADSIIRAIKVDDLLTHHAGLPSAPRALLGKYDMINPYVHVSKEKLTQYMNAYHKPIKSKHVFQYSNLGFGIMGQVLEAITEKPYEVLVKEEICQPLGIEELWISSAGIGINLAPGALRRKKALPRWALNAIGPAGAIDANINDMLKFAKGNLKEHLFYSKCEICHQVHRPISGHLDIGLGWLITRHKGLGEIHSHNGATGGFNSFIGIHPEGEFGVVVLTNCKLSLRTSFGLSNDFASTIGFEGLKSIEQEHHNIKTLPNTKREL